MILVILNYKQNRLFQVWGCGWNLEKNDSLNSFEKIRTLTDLGLTSAQSKIYLTLLKLGHTSIGKIALDSRVARPDTYRVVSELQELGIVEKIVASPTEVKPLPIEDAINILMLRKTKENLEVSKRANKLVEIVKKETKERNPTENSQFALIQGDAIDFEMQRSMFESKKTVCIIGSSRKILQGIISHHQTFLNALKRKVTIQIVTEEPHGFNPPKKVKVLQKFSNFEWRHLIDPQPFGLKSMIAKKFFSPLQKMSLLTRVQF